MAASNLKVPRVDVDDLSIDSRIKNVAKKAGYASSWSLFCTSEKELQEKTKLSGVDIRVLTAAVAEANLPKQRTCLELNQDGEIPPFYISTGCPKLDHFLGGGIPFNGITEIVGESGTGKTQLSLQLALHVQLPKNYGGLGKAVAYICTESQFPIVRLQQMICHMNQKYSLVHKNYEDNIFIYSKYDMDNLVDCVQYQLPLLVSKQDVGLVVIDSVAAVFRSEEGTDINRSQNIQKLGYQLHQLASRNNIAVVAVNQIPKTTDEWREVATAFARTWQFPHCIGAIDGKHVQIKKPIGSGSYYFNYKHTFSIVLMAVVNAHYEFMMVDVGANGRVSDGGVFGNTKFGKKLKEKKLNIPEPTTLPGCPDAMPFVFVADDAFPLLDNLMKPFAHSNLTKSQAIYNYRLSRGRRIVENVFGIMSARFRVLLSTINVSPAKASTIVMACCYLHNYLRKRNAQAYLDGLDMEDENDREVNEVNERSDNQPIPLAPTCTHNETSSAKYIREAFCNYFNDEGSVPWQDSRINI